MTPAILIQTQQVMSVLRCAKPMQEQHLAEMFDCLLDQLSLTGCIPATHTAGSQEEGSLACNGNAVFGCKLVWFRPLPLTWAMLPARMPHPC